jgi:ABC-type uncharacterized transport system permease subunit
MNEYINEIMCFGAGLVVGAVVMLVVGLLWLYRPVKEVVSKW